MSKSLLLADGDDRARGLVRTLLAARNDWEIRDEAADGNEAVAKAKASHPDVAILDMCMPRMDGLAAARQIAQSCRETAVLMISTYDPTLVVDQLKQAGVRGFVSKLSMGSHLIPVP